jgi:hypothetical protein
MGNDNNRTEGGKCGNNGGTALTHGGEQKKKCAKSKQTKKRTRTVREEGV